MRNQLRQWSGLILFTFVTGHLLNHMLGLVSLAAMEAATAVFIDPWRTLLGTVLLVGAILVHAGNALWALWVRRNLKLRGWEAAQLILGLSIPLLLAVHVTANGILPTISGFEASYAGTLYAIAVNSPLRGIIQGVTLIVVWTHGCVGLHNWFRTKPWYAAVQPFAYATALIVPTLSLAGYIASAMQVRRLAGDEAWRNSVFAASGMESWMGEFVYGNEVPFQTICVAVVATILIARWVRQAIRARARKPRLYYSPGNRIAGLGPEATLLESIRAAGIPHASVCGGRGRCSTCRVRVGKGLDDLRPASEAELKVLARVTQSPSVRLACQIRPSADIEVAGLVPPDADAAEAMAKPGYQQGQELSVAFLFVDLRGSTKLSEERLPFDVVFILNQFFAELAAALSETNGHYAQFNGDGLLAIYGLSSGTERGAAEAVDGAKAMLRRMADLNKRLEGELSDELKIGIGIHTGEAIVGSMGPPASPIVSALGDNVNVAARLEAQTKEFGVPLVISADTARLSGVDLSGFPIHRIQVKGREREIEVYAVDDPDQIAARAPAP